MLISLSIKNLALIESMELSFIEGFNVITGETGAGKSVITGAVGLILGNRVDKSMIRHGCERCELSAIFDFHANRAQAICALLDDAAIAWQTESNHVVLHVRRVITPSTTRNFVNDTAVTAQFLAQMAALMIDIHAANEHFSLNDIQTQLDLLDRYCHCDREKALCAEKVSALKLLRADRQKQLAECPTPHEIELLRATVQDIESAQLVPGEEDMIVNKHALVANACEIAEIVQLTTQMTTEGESTVRDQMSEVLHQIDRLAHLDAAQAEIFRNVAVNILAEVSELSRDIERYGNRVEVDEQQLQMLSDRLALIQKYKRRYGPSLEDVFETLDTARRRVDLYAQSESVIAMFDAREKELVRELDEACDLLHDKRERGAAKLAKEVVSLLNKLGFVKARFEFEFREIAPGANGRDQVEMCFSANAGEGVGPLRMLASSGELARVMLAIKAVLSDADTTPILLFDEIDVNIGGETANILGGELQKLAHKHQVICISHLPQVAVQGERHIRVHKTIENERSMTYAEPLDDASRVDEIARMLGGGKPALEHARQLLQNFIRPTQDMLL